MSDRMTCREFTDFLADYFAGELPDAVCTAFDSHLGGCPECIAYLTSYRQTITLSKAAFNHLNDSTPEDVPERLVQAVLAAQRKRQ